MFKWVIKKEGESISKVLEIEKLTDFYQKTPLYQEVDDFPYSQLCDKIDYDIVVLKPEKDDFLILYVNNLFWKLFGKDFPDYMKGRLLGDLFPVFKQTSMIKIYQDSYNNNTSNNFLFKMYEDNTLIFAGEQFFINQNDLLFVFTKDQTDYYLKQESEKLIIDNSTFPIIKINKYGEIIAANNSFLKNSDYTVDELNLVGIDSIFNTFKPRTEKVDNFNEVLNLMFNKKIPVFDFDVELLIKDKPSKWVTVHMRLVNDTEVRLTLRDITENKKNQLIVQNLLNYFSDLEGSQSNVFGVYDGKEFYLTENIFNILEIEPDPELLKDKLNLVTKHLVPEDESIVNRNLKRLLEYQEPVSFEFRIITGKNNLKTLKSDLKVLKDNQIYYGFIVDRTEHYNTQKELGKLQQNLNTIKLSSNVGISEYKNGKYHYSPEIFNILEIEPKEDTFNQDIFKDYVDKKERSSWLELVDNLSPENPNAHKLTTLITDKGNIKIIDNTVEAEFNEKGELIGYTSYVRDVTSEELSKKEALDLQENLDAIGDFSKIYIATYENGEYQYTKELYNILEIDNPEDYSPNEINDIFLLPKDREDFYKFINNVSVDNPEFKTLCRVKTVKGNLRYISVYAKASFTEEGEFKKLVAFEQDITDETLAKNEALELQKNLDIIGGFSKIVIGYYKNEEFTWTNEIYDILKINPEDYPSDVDLIEKFSIDNIDFSNILENLTHDNNTCSTIRELNDNEGNLVYLKYQIIANFDKENKLKSVTGFLQDVTEETLTKMKALRLTENFKLIQDNSKILLCEFENGKYSFTSEAYKLTGVKPGEYPDSFDFVANLIVPEDRDKWEEAFNLTPENPESHVSYRIRNLNDELIYLDVHNAATFNQDGEVSRIVGFIQDVTEETLAKESAMELQENLDVIGGFSKIVIGSYKDGEYTWTPEMYNILKIKAEDYPSDIDLLKEFTSPNDKIEFLDIIKYLTPNNNTCSTVRELIDSEGDLHYLKYQLVGNFDKDNNLESVTAFLLDVTEERLAQEEANELKRTIDEIQGFSKIFLATFERDNFIYTDEVYNILGINPSDYPSEVLINFMVPEDKERFEECMENLSPENPNFKLDYKAIKPNGEPLYISAYNQGIFDDNGELLRVNVFEQDVTEEKLAQEEAIGLKSTMSEIQGFSKIFLFTYENGNFSYTDGVYDVIGVSPEEYSPNDLWDFVIPEDQERISECYNSVTPENPVYKLHYTLIKPDGEPVYINLFSKATFDEDGNVIRINGFEQDVTEEILAKAEALRLTENFELTEKSSKMGFARYEKGKYTFTSEIYNMLGVNPDDYPDTVNMVNDFVIPEDLSKFTENFNLTPEKSYNQVNYRIRNMDGEIRYLDVYNNAKFDDNGELLYIVGFIRDITEKEQAKNEALDLQDSLNTIGGFSKIVIGYYEDGIYTWTPEIYNILKIRPDDFPDDVDLIAEFSTPKDNQEFSDAMDRLSPEDNTFSGTRIVYDNSGELKYLNIKLVAEFDHRGRMLSIHKFIQDVTEETLAKESALDLQRNLGIIQNNSKILIGSYRDGKFSWTSEIYNILEIKPEDYDGNIDPIEEFVIPEEKGVFYDKIRSLTRENSSLHHLATIKTENGNVKILEANAEADFNDKGEVVGFVTLVQDITEKVKREHELEQLSEERQFLLQEVHHRVKNNLQLVSSFLSLDSRFYSDNPEYVIEKTQTRIDAMAATHEEVYRSNDVSNINVESLLVGVLSDLFVKLEAFNISRRYDIETVFIDIDKAMPLSFLVSELAVNTINHAFPDGGKGHFCVQLTAHEDYSVLHVWDDGVGLPEGYDILSSNTLGFTVIRRLAEQLEAEIRVLDKDVGFGVEIVLPKTLVSNFKVISK